MTNNTQPLISDIPIENTSKESDRLKKIRCIRPWTTLEMQLNGDVTFCCKEWTKLSVIGNVKGHSIYKIWNSETARFIRKKMIDGEWDHVCNSEICPVLKSEGYKELDMEKLKDYPYPITEQHIDEIADRKLLVKPPPTYILLGNNDACNIKCPSCYPYREIYKHNENGDYLPDIKKSHQEILKSEDIELSEKVADELIKHNFREICVLRLCGSGDPFYRSDARKILFNKENKPPTLEIEILTNGLLLDAEMWERIKHNNISLIDVSVDAAKKETFERVRNFGKWKTLIKNLHFISELRRENKIPKFLMNFTVMRSNYQEIMPFIFLARELEVDSVYFARVRGQIWKRENFFDGEDHDPTLVEEMRNIKAAAMNLSTPEFFIRFDNL